MVKGYHQADQHNFIIINVLIGLKMEVLWSKIVPNVESIYHVFRGAYFEKAHTPERPRDAA